VPRLFDAACFLIVVQHMSIKIDTPERPSKKRGTRWLHHESIWTKRAFGLAGECDAADHGLVVTHYFRYPALRYDGTIPNVRHPALALSLNLPMLDAARCRYSVELLPDILHPHERVEK
jgi:hypothetical protein